MAWALGIDDSGDEGELYHAVTLAGQEVSPAYERRADARTWAAAYLRRERAAGRHPWHKPSTLTLLGRVVEYPHHWTTYSGDLALTVRAWPTS